MFSLSRGGMVALIVTGIVTFLLIPKRPIHVALFILACLIALRLAGAEVVERFMTATRGQESLDESAQSRLQLWGALFQVACEHPFMGIGSKNWLLVSHLYGLPVGKDGHTLWLHVAAEMGFIGVGLLIIFYGACVIRLWPLARERVPVPDPWLCYFARAVIASVAGFAVSAQFVSVYGVELPIYVVLLGAGCLKLCPVAKTIAHDSVEVPHVCYHSPC
jgi:O-antigen ligase